MSRVQSAIGRENARHGLAPGSATCVNVGELERIGSLVGGSVMLLGGLRRGGLAGLGLAALGGSLIHRGWTGSCRVYRALGLNTASHHNRAASVAAGEGVKVEESIVIQRAPEHLYALWRDLDGLPRFMSHLISVKADGRRSHWTAHGPARTAVEWDAEIITQEPNRLIGWRSLAGSQISTAGSVHFAPLPDGSTEVRISLKYDPPAGKLGEWLAWLFGADPSKQIRDDLQRFKHLTETGVTAGQPRSQTAITG